MNIIHPDFESILLTEKEIAKKTKFLADQINQDYQGKTPTIIAILKGVVPFLSDLSKHFTFYCDYEYVAASSYHGGITTSTWVEIYLWPRLSLKDKDVLIIEDIIDSGFTLQKIKQKVLAEGAKSCKIVTLLDKPSGRKAKINADYVGLTIENQFVVGYGMDFQEKYRNIPYIGLLKPSIYKLNPIHYPWKKGE
jgi:hypoxanthine phosphoribosyltransferase